MLLVGKDLHRIEALKNQLRGELEMKDMGDAKKILGIDIIRRRQIGELFLSQKRYLLKVLERFGMKDSKSVNTPIAAHFKLSET